MTEQESQEFEQLLDYLRSSRGFDFRAHKRSTLQPRIDRRLSMVGVESYKTYRRYLEKEPDEFAHLFNAFLVNVTAFFRDTTPWDFMADHVVPRLLERKRKFDQIRLWSAGCATGEEAYTLAMILAEALGKDEFKSRVKIYATDIDEHALASARLGEYDAKATDGVPGPMLDKYFERSNSHFCFRRDLRRCIVFGRHDLLHDAPISRVDILTCRNTLMYFNAPSQARILARFHFALNEGGYLFLGRAETLLAHMSTFKPEDLMQRVFSKIPSVKLSPQVYLMRTAPGSEPGVDARPVVHDDIPDAALNGRRLQPGLKRTDTDFDSAYEELESANQEMETSNEALQSAVEELETTKEELQASNEELETMNQELQAANEELQSLSEIARAYTGELDQANILLESIFYGLGERVIVVDLDMRVIFWNKGAEELSHVRPEEVKNAPLPSLDIGLPVEELVEGINEILDGKTMRKTMEVDTRNRRGNPIRCRVTIAPLMSGDDKAVIGAILLTADTAVE